MKFDRPRLLGNEEIKLDDLRDAKTGEWRLYPHGPEKAPRHSDALIGVIDSGIAQTHPQIHGMVVASKDWTGEGIEDRLGHGTIVSLRILYADDETKERYKIPKDALPPALIVAKVCKSDGGMQLEDVVSAIDWVVEQGAEIVNLSLGFPGPASKARKLAEAMRRHPKVLFYAAAGNFGPDEKVYPAAFNDSKEGSIENMDSVGSQKHGRREDYSHGAGVYAPGDAFVVSPAEYAKMKLDSAEFAAALQKSRAGDATAAKTLLRKIADTPDHHEAAAALTQLALYALREEKADEAIELLEKSERIHGAKDPEILSHLGAAYFIKGDLQKALSQLNECIDLAPANERALHNRGLVNANLGNMQAALNDFQLVKELNSGYPGIEQMIQQAKHDLKAGQNH